MKIAIFAATGGIGRHILEQAVAAGHEVTAVVRDPAKLSVAPARVVVADLANPDPVAIESAVAGADAVLSGLGPRNPKAPQAITSRGTRAIVNAMLATDARRLVVVSAAPIGTIPSPNHPNPPKHDPGDGFFMRHLGVRIARTLFREHYTDLAVMEDIVRDSGLDWTISRPPQLTDKPLTGVYRTAYGKNIRRGLSISRADAAHSMLHVLDQPETIKQVVGVAY
jgi:putative NADH-flavin reductase